MRTRREPADAGFTLVEVLASLAVVSVVLAATTTFFIRSMATIDMQGVRQAAIQVASDGMEQLRAVPGAHALAWVTARATPATVQSNGMTYEQRPAVQALLRHVTVTLGSISSEAPVHAPPSAEQLQLRW